jgi:hypothetical protein
MVTRVSGRKGGQDRRRRERGNEEGKQEGKEAGKMRGRREEGEKETIEGFLGSNPPRNEMKLNMDSIFQSVPSHLTTKYIEDVGVEEALQFVKVYSTLDSNVRNNF